MTSPVDYPLRETRERARLKPTTVQTNEEKIEANFVA
jgi:hypothetical protein